MTARLGGRRLGRRPTPRAVERPGRWVIAATVLGSGMAMLDSTVVGIALPSINRDFHGGVGTLQWVVTGLPADAGRLPPPRRLARRPLRAASGSSRSGSSGSPSPRPSAALAPSAGLLVAARVVQGVGGALLTPASLAILQASFRPEDRARAIGAWSGLGGVAGGRRTARRRLPPRRRLVALGLLHQPPAGGRRARHHRAPRARVA